MKKEALLTGGIAVFFIVTVAYAAAEISGQEAFSTVLALCFNGVASIGSVVFIAKRYMSQVDKAGETIPAMVATLTATEKAMERHADSIKELYASRDSHDKKLIRIETVHDLRGCNKIIDREGKDNA